MAIPNYREVRDTDDGCCILQCLHCHETWEWRGGSAEVRFCMYCGIRFAGKLESRDHDTPRWMHDLRLRLGDEVYYRRESAIWDRAYVNQRVAPYWIIESRTFWIHGGKEELSQDWYGGHKLPYHLKSAHQAYQYLINVRREEQGEPDEDDLPPAVRFEYRLRRLQPEASVC